MFSCLVILFFSGTENIKKTSKAKYEMMDGVKVFYSIGKYNLIHRNFSFKLTADKIKKVTIDKNSINFKKYGQFEILIDADKFPFKLTEKAKIGHLF